MDNNQTARIIKIEPNYYYEDEKIYDRSYFIFYPGITFLVGCNGSGKTTLMNHVENLFERDRYFSDNSNTRVAKRFNCADTNTTMANMLDGFSSNARSVQFGATMLCSSEGERITQALTEAFNWLWYQNSQEEVKEIWWMLDSFDSGLDIPTIQEIINILYEVFERVLKNNKKLYILVAANNYATIEKKSCIDITSGKTLVFNTWKSYSNYCTRSKKLKEKRYDKQTKQKKPKTERRT